MKNLFKFLCIITFLTGILAFGQNERKKPEIKIKYCKKFTVSVSIGIASVETDVVACYVTVDGWPAIIGGRQQQAANTSESEESKKIDYIYVEEQEMIKSLNVKDSRELENMKIIESGIWDYEGVKYIINPSIKWELIEVEGIKYYALPIQVNE